MVWPYFALVVPNDLTKEVPLLFIFGLSPSYWFLKVRDVGSPYSLGAPLTRFDYVSDVN